MIIVYIVFRTTVTKVFTIFLLCPHRWQLPCAKVIEMETVVLPVMKAVDFMAEAKEVIKLASSLASVNHISPSDPFGQELIAIVEKELTIVMDYMNDIPVDCILNSALRTRIEYVLFMIHHCQRKVSWSCMCQNVPSIS